MKLINIVPRSNLGDFWWQPMQMFLTHMVLEDEKYREFAKEYSGYKILDNSLIELGGAVSLEKVLEAAEMIAADEIILPDVFQDASATIKSVKESLDYLKEKGITKYKLMAVAQGSTVEDWSACFSVLCEMPEIDVIGIPKVLAKTHPEGRPFFEQFWEGCEKEIHLLGLWYSFSEFMEYEHLDKIRSCDTCQLAYILVNGLNFYSVRPDGFTVDLFNDQWEFAMLCKHHNNLVELMNYIE